MDNEYITKENVIKLLELNQDKFYKYQEKQSKRNFIILIFVMTIIILILVIVIIWFYGYYNYPPIKNYVNDSYINHYNN